MMSEHECSIRNIGTLQTYLMLSIMVVSWITHICTWRMSKHKYYMLLSLMIMSCSHQYIMIISWLPSHIILFNAGLFITCIVFILILIIYQYIYAAISLSIDIDNYIYIYIDMHITYLYIHMSCMYPVSGSCNRLKHVGVFSFDLWFAGGGDP